MPNTYTITNNSFELPATFHQGGYLLIVIKGKFDMKSIFFKETNNFVSRLVVAIRGHFLSGICGLRAANLYSRVRLCVTSGNDICCLGRSMIEMLGVLAIIGVLSVAGIAGYSKAMTKWKINKAVQEYIYLIQGILEHINDFKLSSGVGDRINFTNYIAAIGLSPSNWELKNNNLYDSVGNYLYVFSEGQGVLMSIHIGDNEKNENNQYVSNGWSPDFCRYLLANVAKPLASEIIHSYIYKDGKTIAFYGTKYCSTSKKCLNTLTLEEINNACNSCEKGKNDCHVTLAFY